MSKQIQLVLPILAIFAFNRAAGNFQYIGNTNNPDIPNHCHYAQYDWIVPINYTLYPAILGLNTCMKLFCRDDYVLIIRHCDRVNLDTCKLSEYNYGQPFPACCPLISCSDRIYRTQDDI